MATATGILRTAIQPYRQSNADYGHRTCVITGVDSVVLPHTNIG